MTVSTIRPRDRDALVQALRAGVVPRVGQDLIRVGRVPEFEAVSDDLAAMKDGGSMLRLIIGEYGSGKTFFMHSMRAAALSQGFVTMHADLSPDRRLHASGGQARALFAQMTANLSTKTNPDGGGMAGMVERFVGEAIKRAGRRNLDPGDLIRSALDHFREYEGGYDFGAVIGKYWEAHDSGNDELKLHALRWLRGEYSSKLDARRDLGVRAIIDDSNFYDQIKLLSQFAKLSGYNGLLVVLDELVNLYKLSNSQARTKNYEQILRIFNDTLQGGSSHIGFLFGGTPEFLTDTRRGLYSYEALRSRLAENIFATDGFVDHTGPVLRLPPLSRKEFIELLTKLRFVYAGGDSEKLLLPDAALHAFVVHCESRIGDAYFRTPRTTIKEFVDLLAVVRQNPSADWRNLIGEVDVIADVDPALGVVEIVDAVDGTDSSELAAFRL